MKNYYGYGRMVLLYCIFIYSTPSIYSLHGKPFTPTPFTLPRILPAPIQERVSGTVTDAQGVALPGVTVRIQDTNQGTYTNLDGRFVLQVQPGDRILFSAMGFQSQEVVWEDQTGLAVVLQEDITSLEAITVNAGYYKTTEKESTGNIAQVGGEELVMQPVVNPIQALQGRMAGVSIVQKSGVPGNAASIEIRGQNSLRTGFGTSGNLPLYIIDGVPLSSAPLGSSSGLTSQNVTGIDPLNTLNLSNIASIEILKDADATAIYGSRGANGVVLITTKQGKGYDQPTQLSARVYRGAGWVANRIDLLHTEDYLNLRKEAFENDGATPSAFNAPDLLFWDPDRYTDWQDVFFGGTAHTTDVNLTMTGGSATTSFQLGGGYHEESTVFPGEYGYQKLTMGMGLNHHSKDDCFQLQLSANYGADMNSLFDGSSFVSNAISLAPNAPELYTEDGALNWEASTWDNPLAVLYRESDARVQQLIGSLTLSYTLGAGFTIKANTGYTHLNSKEVVKQPIRFYDPALWDNVEHRSLHLDTQRSSWIVEPQVVYSHSLGDFDIDGLLGTTFQQGKQYTLNTLATGYANAQLIGNLEAADIVTVPTHQESQYNYTAAFARLGVHYKNRYLLNLTGRRDGSSRFGASRQFANFGAVGAAWIFSEEPWMQEESWLSFGKFRGSYGSTGSDQIGDYGYLDTYSATPGPGGLYPTQLTNPDYSWESNRKLELALDLGFFKDRLQVNTSWYRNRSSNQLVGYPLPAITGFSTVQANLDATVENRGWELEVSTINLHTDRWRWETSINLSFPENTLVSFPGIDQTSYANIYTVGEPLNIQKLYRYTGLDAETGLYTVADVNDDGTLDFEDRVVQQNLGRTAFGGIRNQITYGKLTLDFLWEYVEQEGKRYFPTTSMGRFGNVLQEDYDQRWIMAGDDNGVQRASRGISSLLSYYRGLDSNLGVQDNSFLRLKTLGLSYQLSLEKLSIDSCTLFVQGQNLITITKYNGLDPQFLGNTLPALRMMTAGFDINF